MPEPQRTSKIFENEHDRLLQDIYIWTTQPQIYLCVLGQTTFKKFFTVNVLYLVPVH